MALQQIDSLSGGQKSRVAFAVLCGHNPNFLADCEYLILPKLEWHKCQDLPMPLYAAQLVEDPDTGDVLLLGATKQDTIYRLSDILGEWILQEKTLQAPRSQFSAMVVPSPGILSCNTKHDEL